MKIKYVYNKKEIQKIKTKLKDIQEMVYKMQIDRFKLSPYDFVDLRNEITKLEKSILGENND